MAEGEEEEGSLRFLFVGVVALGVVVGLGFGVVVLGFFLLPGVEVALTFGCGVAVVEVPLVSVTWDLSLARRWVRAFGVHSGMR